MDSHRWHVWNDDTTSLRHTHALALYVRPTHVVTHINFTLKLSSILDELRPFHEREFVGSSFSWSLHGPLALPFEVHDIGGEAGASALFEALREIAMSILGAKRALPPCVAASTESCIPPPTMVCVLVFIDWGQESCTGASASALHKYFVFRNSARVERQLCQDDDAISRVHAQLSSITRAGGSRAGYLGRVSLPSLPHAVGLGLGLITCEAWHVPTIPGCAAVASHEGIGHAIGMPHPDDDDPQRDVCVMGGGMYSGLPLSSCCVSNRIKAGMRRGEGAGRAGVTFLVQEGGAGEEGVSPLDVVRTVLCSAAGRSLLAACNPCAWLSVLAWVFDSEDCTGFVWCEGDAGGVGEWTASATCLLCTTPIEEYVEVREEEREGGHANIAAAALAAARHAAPPTAAPPPSSMPWWQAACVPVEDGLPALVSEAIGGITRRAVAAAHKGQEKGEESLLEREGGTTPTDTGGSPGRTWVETRMVVRVRVPKERTCEPLDGSLSAKSLYTFQEHEGHHGEVHLIDEGRSLAICIDKPLEAGQGPPARSTEGIITCAAQDVKAQLRAGQRLQAFPGGLGYTPFHTGLWVQVQVPMLPAAQT